MQSFFIFLKNKGAQVNLCFKHCLIICMLVAVKSAAETDSDLANQVTYHPVFGQPLAWVGSQPPPGTESTALSADMNIFKTEGVPSGISALENFVNKYPDSAWKPAVNVNLAEYYRAQGRYSLALTNWEAAWNAIKAGNDPVSQYLAVRTIAGWTRLLATLGEKEKLNKLFKEFDQLQLPRGIYGTEIQETEQALGVMNGRPGISYRCGSFALGHLANAMHLNSGICRRLDEIDSPDGGFHMDQLLRLAETNGMQVEAVRRPAGAPLIVPSIVHWKLNHYAAIMQEKNGRYFVEDPTFGGGLWMDGQVISDEASGEFILPKDKVPSNWKQLSAAECSAIYGKGVGNTVNNSSDNGPPACPQGGDGNQDSDDSNCYPPSPNDGAANSTNNPPSPPPCDCFDDPQPIGTYGMPHWYVSEPYETLWIEDVPLLYRQSNGKWMQLRLTYKSTGLPQPTLLTGFGVDWSCNWIGYMQPSSSGLVSNYLAGGGVEGFDPSGTPDYKTARVLSSNGSGGYNLGAPSGAQNAYNYSSTPTGSSTPNYLLTQRLDRYGRILQQMDYATGSGLDGSLNDVVDEDGKTNIVELGGNGLGAWCVITVTNPYNSVAQFNYDGRGIRGINEVLFLTNIIDVQGFSTSFKYDNDYRITNMVTPYGTNSFQYYSGVDANNYIEMALLITEPTGDHQLYVYRDDSPDSIPYPGDDYPSYRMSFHWNRAQYEALAGDWQTYGFNMPQSDYQKASIKHWLHDDTLIVGDTLDSSADPYDPNLGTRPNCYTYSYYGESPPFIGTLKRVTSISINGQKALDIGVNPIGRPTNFVYYGSDGSTASYTNYFDSSGKILQAEGGPRGEHTRGYGFDPTINNLLTSVTNAVGDVTKYTYDTSAGPIKLTSTTFPGGMVQTNIYYTSGPNKGFLAEQANIGFDTNYFDYINGNLCLETNELELVVTNTYDNLNRLLSTTYPDGTVESNVYSNLDLVATMDRLGQWAYYGYNSVRQLIAVTNVDGEVTTYGYCSCGSPDAITNWNGSTPLITSLNYDTIGRLSSAILPDGYQLNYTYDTNDRVQTVTDGGGNQLDYTYALVGKNSLVSSEKLGSQLLQTNEFDEYGRITNEVNRNNIITASSYDLLNRLSTRQNFGSDGKFTGQEKFFYSALGLTNYIDQLGHLTAYVRDAAGRILYETNANNEVVQFSYNPADELQTLTDGKNQITTWNYDEFGNVTNKIDCAGNTNFIYQYDVLNRLTSRWTPAKGTTLYSYDSLGNLTYVDYSGGTVSTPSISYSYDGLNRLISMSDGIGTTAFGWTDGNQLQNETGPWANDALNYTYANRLRASMALQQPNAPPWTQNYGYDSVMRLSTITSPAGATSITSPSGSFIYEYSGGGDLVQGIEFPSSGSVYTTNLYDSLGRLTNTYMSSSYAAITDQHSYSYDLGSEITQHVFTAANYINYTYDNIGQILTAKGFESGGATARLHEQFGYTYDKAWNLAHKTNNLFLTAFTVNNLNELSSASPSGTYTVSGSATELRGSVTGTPPGVTNVTVNGQTNFLYADGTFADPGLSLSPGNNTFTAIGKDTYGRASTNIVTTSYSSSSSYTYDLNGNLTSDGRRNFAYDDENQLIGVWVVNSWSNSFAYDGLQRKRVEQDYSWSGSAWQQTNAVRYLYDGNLVMQERDQNNLPLTTYTRGVDFSGGLEGAGGIGGLLARSDKQQIIPLILSANNPNPQYVVTSYYHNDASGNITTLIQQNGFPIANYQYDPFGNMISMSGILAGANKYRFSSKEWNENEGLYYYGYRFYDPNLQRWPNRDPMGDLGSLTYLLPSLDQDAESDDGGGLTSDELLNGFTQINLNLFGAIGNNPVNQIDPTGLQCDGEATLAAEPTLLMDDAEAAAYRAAQAARQRAAQTLKDVADKVKNIEKALDKTHLKAARQELKGNPVKFKPDGTAYDHVQEVRDAQRGLANQIDKLKNALKGTPGDSAESLQLQKQISQLSKFLDYTKGYCPAP
ncbi:MAG TPA: polymorphic toxin type 28 domain-containing protein [Pseudomonadales bacterium]|nr:polymorphic toxin type 28 domain-containing protein [Pseudomonadales bacterium]